MSLKLVSHFRKVQIGVNNTSTQKAPLPIGKLACNPKKRPFEKGNTKRKTLADMGFEPKRK